MKFGRINRYTDGPGEGITPVPSWAQLWAGWRNDTVPSLFPNFIKVFKQLLEAVGVEG